MPQSKPERTGTPLPGRRERHKREKRERLLRCAIELFVTQGYAGTSVAEIAERAVVARATAFKYFPRKEDFIAAWFRQRRTMIAETLNRAPNEDVQAPARVAEALVNDAAIT